MASIMLCTRGIYYKKSGQRNNKNKKKTWWRTLNTMENALRRQSHSIGGGRGGHSIVLVPVFLALGRLWTSCRFSHDDLRRERWREETYEWPSKWLRTSWGNGELTESLTTSPSNQMGFSTLADVLILSRSVKSSASRLLSPPKHFFIKFCH